MSSCPQLRLVVAGRGRMTMSQPVLVDTIVKVARNYRKADDADAAAGGGAPELKLVYIGTASYDREESFENQTEGYSKFCKVIKLELGELGTEAPCDFLPVLESADIIMVSFGNTLYAMTRWQELGVDAILKRLASKGTVVCGGSAGSIVWFEQGHSDSMNPTSFLRVDPNLTEEQKADWKYIRVNGLGVLPAFCVPHHDVTQTNGIARSVDSQTMMWEKPEQPCFGLDEKAALVIENGLAKVVSLDGIAQCYVKFCQPATGKVLTKSFGVAQGVIRVEDLWKGKF